MKELLIKIQLSDLTKGLPDNVIKQLGLDHQPMRRFRIEDDQDVDKFLSDMSVTLKRKGLRVQKMEVVNITQL